MQWIKRLFGWMFGWLFSDAPPTPEDEDPKEKRFRPSTRKRDRLRQHVLYNTGKSPIGHATGTNFVNDVSTTRAVRHRMKNIYYYLRGESPPPMDLRKESK